MPYEFANLGRGAGGGAEYNDAQVQLAAGGFLRVSFVVNGL